MEIHHLDFNRDDNDISNLLLLPKELHQRFHKSMPYYEIGYKSISPNLKSINPCAPNFEIIMLKTYLDTILEIQEWIGYKSMCYRLHKIESVKTID